MREPTECGPGKRLAPRFFVCIHSLKIDLRLRSQDKHNQTKMEEQQLKARFLSLYCMVMADGIVEAKELETLYRIGLENYHLTADEINKFVVTAGNSFVAPDRLEDKIGVLYEMAEIAWADGQIDDTEKSLLARYAVRLGFQEETAGEICEYMIQQVKDGHSRNEVVNEIANA